MKRQKNQIEKGRESLKSKILRIMLGFMAITIPLIALLPGVMAHCPLCTGATIVGVGITRSFGLDDSIVGVFVGGMVISTALWMDNVLKKKNMGKGNDKLRVFSLIFLASILTLLTFYYAGLFGRGNEFRIFGIESILVGSVSGGILSLASFYYSNHLKRKNGGKVLFNYQTMVLSLAVLIANAVLFAIII